MVSFPSHTADSAPQDATSILEQAEQKMGFIPNMYRHMAEAPAVLEGYTTLAEIFGKSSFSQQQQQLVLLAVSLENGCDFCVTAHSRMAVDTGVDSTAVEAIKNGSDPGDDGIEALVSFARLMVRERGHMDRESMDTFLSHGFTHQQILEVTLGVALKTLSNYTNHIAQTEVNEELKSA